MTDVRMYAGAEDPNGLRRAMSRRTPRVRQGDPILEALSRELEAYPQIEISEKTGYAQATISAFWLSQRANPKFSFVRDLATLFGYELRLVKVDKKAELRKLE